MLAGVLRRLALTLGIIFLLLALRLACRLALLALGLELRVALGGRTERRLARLLALLPLRLAARALIYLYMVAAARANGRDARVRAVARAPLAAGAMPFELGVPVAPLCPFCCLGRDGMAVELRECGGGRKWEGPRYPYAPELDMHRMPSEEVPSQNPPGGREMAC